MKAWVALAGLSAIAWTGQALAMRGATRTLDGVTAAVYAVFVEALIGVVWVTWWRPPVPLASGSWVVAAGVCGMIGFALYGMAVMAAPSVGVTTAVSALYPVLVLMLAMPMFDEPWTWTRAGAVACAVAAVVLAASD